MAARVGVPAVLSRSGQRRLGVVGAHVVGALSIGSGLVVAARSDPSRLKLLAADLAALATGGDQKRMQADPAPASGGLGFGLAGVAGVDLQGPLGDVDARMRTVDVDERPPQPGEFARGGGRT